MQAPDGPPARRVGLIVLHKPRLDTYTGKGSLVMGLDEIPSTVRKTARFEQAKTGQPQIFYVHGANELAEELRVKQEAAGSLGPSGNSGRLRNFKGLREPLHRQSRTGKHGLPQKSIALRRKHKY